MACSFSANQFQKEFEPTRLCNWQVPKWHPSRPVQRKNATRIISNDRGHLLIGIPRPGTNPWGTFKGTWQLPDKISKHQAFELNAPNVGGSRWAKPSGAANTNPLETKLSDLSVGEHSEDKQEYIPGDHLTNPQDHHPSRQHLLNRKNFEEEEDQRKNDLYLEKHECTDRVSLLNEECKKLRERIPHILGENIQEIPEEMRREVTEKPGTQQQLPLVPAFYNFETARKMAQENLEHQPLPDSIMDRAFRKYQAQGILNPGLALDVIPTATGVGVKTYKAGPTHCTKLKVYRPKTCGVVPRPLDKTKFGNRPHTSVEKKENMGPMDLAICWDFKPFDVRDEPKPPTHIDGSNGSSAPAVFTLVKTPRSVATPDINTGRSGGVFSNTLGEANFFDKDILRKHNEFGGGGDTCNENEVLSDNRKRHQSGKQTCTCGTSVASWKSNNSQNNDENSVRNYRPKSLIRNSDNHRQQKQRCKSSPNISQLAVSDEHNEQHKHNLNNNIIYCTHNLQHISRKSKFAEATPLANLRTDRLYHHHTFESQNKLQNQQQKIDSKIPFKSGIPNSNSSGTCTSFDSGCTGSNVSANQLMTSKQHVVKVPKPRNPYMKNNYVITTLAPPFACFYGGAGQGGYPEHWRLASVYQHAYKPVKQRKRPLLATVYQ